MINRRRNSIIANILFAIIIFSFLPLPAASSNILIQSYKTIENKEGIKKSSQIYDGPYVFYREGEILVKSIVKHDSSFIEHTKSYFKKSEIRLACFVSETGDSFNFPLKRKMLIPNSKYSLPKKMFVVSDIHGNFAGFKMILQGAGVIDKKLNWSYGDGHFVFVGDVFDRGMHVTECLWLMYKLEAEADAAGGKIHFILGNHEIMNLHGNTKYVQNKYIEHAKMLQERYIDLFSNQTEIGKWLRTKNAIEKIGSYLFTHGGISAELVASDLSLDQINHIVRKNIGVETRDYKDSIDKIVNGSLGVFWYRGLAEKKLSENELDKILTFAKSSKIIIGHTIFEKLTSLYNGKVLAIDLEHQQNSDNGFMEGLIIEDNKFFSIDEKGNKKLLLDDK